MGYPLCSSCGVFDVEFEIGEVKGEPVLGVHLPCDLWVRSKLELYAAINWTIVEATDRTVK